MDQAWTVEAELERIHHQRVAAERQVVDDDQRESRLLAGLLPASAALAAILADLERRTPSIRSQRRHGVEVFLRQPRADCIRASLRWGRKFALTDADRQLMRSYQRRRHRLQRYPEVVVACEYFELSGVLSATGQSLELGSGETFPLAHFVAQPAIVLPALTATLRRPPLVRRDHLRSNDYRAPAMPGG
ncbi:MAG: hypothetical protein M3P97_05820 [Actinomycetota bacterium]|nr:hypothetical protein [Actinomycetota bacterium]